VNQQPLQRKDDNECVLTAPAFSHVQWDLADSAPARWQTAGLAAAMVTFTAAMVRWPAVYWRHRAWLMSVARVLLYATPVLRQTGVSGGSRSSKQC